jgi:hypothetical protein
MVSSSAIVAVAALVLGASAQVTPCLYQEYVCGSVLTANGTALFQSFSCPQLYLVQYNIDPGLQAIWKPLWLQQSMLLAHRPNHLLLLPRSWRMSFSDA